MRAIGCLLLLAIVAIVAMLARNYVRDHPQDVPWTELRLEDPIGRFTARKLVALTGDAAACRALLADKAAFAIPAPSRRHSPQCGYDDGMRLQSGGGSGFDPSAPVTSCPVAAAMFLWQRDVLEPAALRHFGARVVRIGHVGSYSCRRLYNRSDGPFSEHATANAFDIVGFTLDDGTSVSILRDWNSVGPKSAFLKEIRTGACSLFSTVLSPDYNEAHADHLHLDQADRGARGWRMCR